LDRDARRMRGDRRFLFTSLKADGDVGGVVEFIVDQGGLAR